MKKRITLVMEVESDDTINLQDNFIRNDLEQEISCASNYYELLSFETATIEENRKMTEEFENKIKEQIEKLQFGLMVCEAANTDLVHIDRTDAKIILDTLILALKE